MTLDNIMDYKPSRYMRSKKRYERRKVKQVQLFDEIGDNLLSVNHKIAVKERLPNY